MPEWFIRITTLTECSHEGLVFYDGANEFGLEISEGAIPEQETVAIDIGVAMYGPFEFPEGLKPVSPVFWVCVRESKLSRFLKPVTITIPHCVDLDRCETIDSLGLTFLKGEHDINFQHTYQFQTVEEAEMVFEAHQTKGTLKTTHFCSLCITGKVSPELTKHTKFCIYTVIPPSVAPSEPAYCHFFISFLLPTCFKTVEEQITLTQELQDHKKIIGDFKFSSKQEDPGLEIVIPDSTASEWNIGLMCKTKVCYIQTFCLSLCNIYCLFL